MVGILLFTSCKEKAINYYVPAETILSYKQDDTLIYKDEEGNQNSFVVSDIRDGFFKKGAADEVYIQQYSVYFKKINNTLDSSYYEIIIDINYSQSLFWEKSLYSVYSANMYPILDGFKVFSDTYDGVRQVSFRQKNGNTDTIYYQYKFGIIQYKDINGKDWKLYSKPIH
jgi:hypothetical protein